MIELVIDLYVVWPHFSEGFYIIFCVRFIINTKIIFKGLENIPKNRKFFVASAHQSICETFVFNAILNAPIFIVKAELFKKGSCG